MAARPRIYLDHAATTPVLPEARAAMAAAFDRWANPSSPHEEGRQARAALEDARRRIAAAYRWAGPVILTSGASEAALLAIRGAVADRRLFAAVEHEAVLRGDRDAAILPVNEHGTLLETGLAAALAGGGGRALVAVQWANSETGVLQPLAALAPVVHAAGGLLLVDAAQLPPERADDIAGADMAILSAHKIGGPPGIGALLLRDFALLRAGGGQEQGYRGGTENLPAALGWAAALAARPADSGDTLRALRTRIEHGVADALGTAVGGMAPRTAHIGAYRLPGMAATAQLIRLDMAGIAVSAGSACSSGSMKPSHVLAAMGWSEAHAREVIRVSIAPSTTAAEVDAFVALWGAMAADARARTA